MGPNSNVFSRVVQEAPSIHLLHVPTYAGALAKVCTGEADATWLDARLIYQAVLNPASPCKLVALDFWLPQEALGYAIGSTFAKKHVADRLYAEIEEMAGEGRLLALAADWKLFRRADSSMVFWLMEVHRRNLKLRYGLYFSVLVLLGMIYVWRRTRLAHIAAQQASKARSSFLANMSHELRTPMNGVLGMIDLTLTSKLEKDQFEQLTIAKSSADTLLALLNDILDFSRIDSGKVLLESVPFEIGGVIEQCRRLLGPIGQKKGLDFSFFIDAGVPEQVIGDPLRVQQVLWNLAGNAVKFTERGKVTIGVYLDSRDENSVGIRFSVQDTGIGIPADQLSKIFESFSQADRSITRRYGGSGLGLAISRQLAKMMRGNLTVRSTIGVGTVFDFTCNFQLVKQVGQRNDRRPNGAQQDSPKGLRILVAEDNPVNQLLARRILERAGHSVVMVVNGLEALAALHNSAFDLALFDIQMPEMGGLEAVKRLRRHEEDLNRPRTPVIAVTAHALKGDAEHCLKSGMDSYVSKPIDAAKLLAEIGRVVSNQSATVSV